MNQPNSNDKDRAQRSQREPVRIGAWVLHPDLALLRRTGSEVRLNPKALQTLLVLVDAGQRGVSRDELLDRVWGENYPSDYVVSRAIADLRSALGEKAGQHKYIRTLPKYGYQLVARTGKQEPGAGRPQSQSMFMAAGLALLLIGLVSVFWMTKETPGPAIFPAPRPLTAAPGLEHQPRISADGKWVIYAALKPERADWDIFRVSLESGESQPVATSDSATEHGPAFSPAGDELAYVRFGPGACEIVIQPVNIGVPRPVASCTQRFPSLVDWSADGNWLAYTVNEENDPDSLRRIYRVNPRGGDPIAVSRAVSPTGSDFYPRFSPNGSKLAFLRGEPQPDHRSTLWLAELETESEIALTRQAATLGGMTWIDNDNLLYATSEAGRMVSRIINTRTGIDQPVVLENNIHPDFKPDTGTLATVRMRRDRDLEILHPDSSTRAIASSTSDDLSARFSADEQWITLISRRSGFEEVWIASTSNDAVRQLTRFGGANIRYPSWHPDGETILFTAEGESGEHLFLVDVVGGTVQALDLPYDQATTPSWLPSGAGMVFGCVTEQKRGICLSDDSGTRVIINDFFKPQAISDDSIVAVNNGGVLHRITLHDGSSQALWNGLPGKGRYGWLIDGDEIVYTTGGSGGESGRILRRNLETGQSILLYEGHMPVADTILSIGPETGAIMFTRFLASSDDLLLYEELSFDNSNP